MKKKIRLLTSVLISMPLIFSTGCTKSVSATNWAIVLQDSSYVPQVVDSVETSQPNVPLQINIFLNHKTNAHLDIFFLSPLSQYKLGSQGLGGNSMTLLAYYSADGITNYETISKTTGNFTISKNDPNTKRMEGSLSNSLLFSDGTKSVIVNCNFGVSY